MPFLRLETNVPDDQIPKDLTKNLCKILSSSTGKPLNYCVATIVGGANMSWGSSSDPAALASLTSIGSLGAADNRKHSKALFSLICKELSISPERMYICFNDVATSNLGYNGTTFEEIFK